VNPSMGETSKQVGSETSLKRPRTLQKSLQGPSQKKLKWEMRTRETTKPIREYDTDELFDEDDEDTENDSGETSDEDSVESSEWEATTFMDPPKVGTEPGHHGGLFEDTSLESRSTLDKTCESPHSASPPPKGRVWTWSEAEPHPPSKTTNRNDKTASTVENPLSEDIDKPASLPTDSQMMPQMKLSMLRGNPSPISKVEISSVVPTEGKPLTIEDDKSTGYLPPTNKTGSARLVGDTTSKVTNNRPKIKLRLVRVKDLRGPGLSSGSTKQPPPQPTPENQNPQASISESLMSPISSETSIKQSRTSSHLEPEADLTPEALTLPITRCQYSSVPIPNSHPAVTSIERSPSVHRRSIGSTTCIFTKESASVRHSVTPAPPKLESSDLEKVVAASNTDRGIGSGSPPAPNPRSNPQMTLFIITRKPFYTEEYWLNGRIQGISLSEFFDELEMYTQRGGIEKVKLTLKLTLQGSVSAFVATVLRNDENSWHIAKRMFNNGLKQAKLKVNARDVAALGSIDVHVEPFYVETENLMMHAVEDEDFF
jgi:hypothetical protein